VSAFKAISTSRSNGIAAERTGGQHEQDDVSEIQNEWIQALDVGDAPNSLPLPRGIVDGMKRLAVEMRVIL
jgi:hypothetical protein